MNWAHGLQMLLGIAFLCCVLACVYPYLAVRLLKRRNRKYNLRPPIPDERDSIANFRRMHRQ